LNNCIINALTSLLPNSCLLCDAPSQHPLYDLCDHCEQELPYLSNGCERCGLPLADGVSGTCGQCITNPPHYDRCFSLFNYAAPVDKLVQNLKFNGKLVIARSLGQLFAQRTAKWNAPPLGECIIPVPLHKNRIRQRGFNQAMELARPISKSLNITIDKTSCTRIIDTQPQSSLDADDRGKNIRHAFSVKPEIKWKRVILFDDVITTGQTINSLAKELKLNGVEEVSVWCIAGALL